MRLVVTSTTNIDHVYVTESNDNGVTMPLVASSDYTDSLGNTFKAGGTSGASYTTSNTKSFVLMVPVSIRTTSSAVSDVYTIWFTNGAGNFLKPTKNIVLGPVKFTLNYSTTPVITFSSATGIQLGDQSATPGSLLVTSGQISALQTADYNDAPGSADLSLSALDANGTAKTNQSGILWLVSPSIRLSLGYPSANEPTSPAPNVTYISAYTGSVDFGNVTGADLTALSVGNSTKVQIANNGVYQFVTSTGKKGLLQVTALNSNTTAAGSTATVSVKVLN